MTTPTNDPASLSWRVPLRYYLMRRGADRGIVIGAVFAVSLCLLLALVALTDFANMRDIAVKGIISLSLAAAGILSMYAVGILAICAIDQLCPTLITIDQTAIRINRRRIPYGDIVSIIITARNDRPFMLTVVKRDGLRRDIGLAKSIDHRRIESFVRSVAGDDLSFRFASV